MREISEVLIAYGATLREMAYIRWQSPPTGSTLPREAGITRHIFFLKTAPPHYGTTQREVGYVRWQSPPMGSTLPWEAGLPLMMAICISSIKPAPPPYGSSLEQLLYIRWQSPPTDSTLSRDFTTRSIFFLKPAPPHYGATKWKVAQI